MCCLLKFVIVDLILPFICLHQSDIKVPLRLLTFVIFVFLIGMTFIFILTVVTSLTLNAEFFNPFVAPILTLIIYVWKNWKSSVEAKCRDLKTLTIDVSLEKAKAQKDEQISSEDCARATSSKRSRDKIRILEFLCPRLSCTGSLEIAEKVIELEKFGLSGLVNTSGNFSNQNPGGNNKNKEAKLRKQPQIRPMIADLQHQMLKNKILNLINIARQ